MHWQRVQKGEPNGMIHKLQRALALNVMPVKEFQIEDNSLYPYASNVVVALTAFCVVYYVLREFKWMRNLANIPPGPKPLPFVGNCGHFITRYLVSGLLRKDRNSAVLSPHIILMEQSHIYGNIYSVFVGKQMVVILTGYEVIKEALLNRADVFSDRPDIPIITILTKRRGKS